MPSHIEQIASAVLLALRPVKEAYGLRFLEHLGGPETQDLFKSETTVARIHGPGLAVGEAQTEQISQSAGVYRLSVGLRVLIFSDDTRGRKWRLTGGREGSGIWALDGAVRAALDGFCPEGLTGFADSKAFPVRVGTGAMVEVTDEYSVRGVEVTAETPVVL